MGMICNIRKRAQKVSNNFYANVENARNRRRSINKIRLWRIK